jgi:hypothetical protein
MDLQQTNMPQTPFDIFELLSKILSFLPRCIVNSEYDPARDSNLMCSGVSLNWHTVARRSANWQVDVKPEAKARRFLAALMSNDSFVERNPGWPRLDSTRSLVLGNVSGLFPILVFVRSELVCPRSTISIPGAKEWKRICPNLRTVHFSGGGGLSEEVKAQASVAGIGGDG